MQQLQPRHGRRRGQQQRRSQRRAAERRELDAEQPRTVELHVNQPLPEIVDEIVMQNVPALSILVGMSNQPPLWQPQQLPLLPQNPQADELVHQQQNLQDNHVNEEQNENMDIEHNNN